MLALVVDDSRMARYVLGKMLKEQGIDVDAVESAEEALGYLCGKHPDMIFMDHTMPGMNGIQALRAIKNDPKTTAIPIMMYTSKEGEVYMSQARKAGAAEVLPKQLKPEQLIEVLQRQKLLPGKARRPIASGDSDEDNLRFDDIISTSDTGEDIIQVARAAEESVSNRQFTHQVRAILQQHKDELAEQSQARTDHLLASMEERIDHLVQGLDAATQQFTAERSLKGSNGQRLSSVLTVSLTGIVLIWLLISNTRLSQQLSQSQHQLADLTVQQSSAQTLTETSVSALQDELISTQQRSEQILQGLIDALQWSLNQANQVTWQDPLFNDRLATQLESLLPYLYNTGFVGTLTLTSHLGRFCTTTVENGEDTLPSPDSVVSLCHIENPREHETLHKGMAQSTQFERALLNFHKQYGDSIRVELRTAGTRLPIQPYPNLTPEMTAGDWNGIAHSNHRVDIQIAAAP